MNNLSDLQKGVKYVVNNVRSPVLTTEFKVGDVVEVDHFDYTYNPRFKRLIGGKTQYLHYSQVVPFVEPAASVNKYGFKVGDKFNVIHAEDFSIGDVVTLINDDGSPCPYFRNQNGKEMFEYYEYLQLIVEGSPVEIAKANLAKAQAELDAAVKAEEDSKKFQESDIKSFMFVAVKDEKVKPLRLVVIAGDNVSFFNAEGTRTNECPRTELLKDLNWMYEKTTKTIKDFANA